MEAQQHTERWQVAEMLLRKLTSEKNVSNEASQEICAVFQELRTYQTELELQNARLRTSEQFVQGERQRIAYNLHDAINQSLFSAYLISEVLLDPFQPILSDERMYLYHLNASIKRAIAEMRVLSLELRPERLLDTPLKTLLHLLIYVVDDTKVTIDCDSASLPSDNVKIAIYRMTQEALKNIHQHAHAGAIQIQLRQTVECIHFHIDDDGVGFDTGRIRLGSGLHHIRSGVEASGGQFHINSQLNAGTQLLAEW
jgi:signal transduction histidine kinase